MKVPDRLPTKYTLSRTFISLSTFSESVSKIPHLVMTKNLSKKARHSIEYTGIRSQGTQKGSTHKGATP